MKIIYPLLLMITGLFLTNPTFGQTIWDGPSMVFSKSAFANPTLEENQDRITDNVWITRGNTQGLFNAKTESGYNPNAPADTEWAQGTTAEIGSLNFQSWVDAINSNPPGSIGTDYVLHLISEDIYIDIRFTSWGQGSSAGGGFSYSRSTPPLTSTNDTELQQAVVLSPNPASDILFIQSEILENNYKIFRLSDGALIKTLDSTEGNKIMTGNWSPGHYVLVSDQGTVSQFVKI